MKKILLVIAMLAVLLMIGCNKNEKIEENNVQEAQNSQQSNNIVETGNKSTSVSSIENYPDLVKEAVKLQNGLDVFQALIKIYIDGSEHPWYALTAGDAPMLYDENGEIVDSFSWEPDVYYTNMLTIKVDENDKPYFDVYTGDMNNTVIERYYLKYENEKVISYKK